MKIVLALDSFKGSLTAVEACASAAEGWLSACPSAEVVCKPMADGGEGTAQALMASRGGEWRPCEVMGPLPSQRVLAGYAWFAKERMALVEMAAASGITLLKQEELNPLRTTTYGTGELLLAALKAGAQKILLALGGSATVDGGVGMAQALGWRVLDRAGHPVPPGGASLSRIEHIAPPAGWQVPPVEALTDVTNPLLGPRGAAHVFGPQKGATPAMVEELERGLAHWADVVRRDVGREVAEVPGAGAAGGLGAGAMAFLNANITSGIRAIMQASNLEEAMTGADWVITGEGRLDPQSFDGKVVSGVLELAARKKVRVAVLAGCVQYAPAEWARRGILAVEACATPGLPLDYAIAHAAELLKNAAARLAGNLFEKQ